MKADKSSEFRLSSRQQATLGDWPSPEAEPDNSINHPGQIYPIIRRAVITYLVLLFGFGAIMTLVGVNPLANQGLMPKALLLFVGLALLLALTNTLSSHSYEHPYEHRRDWTRLMNGVLTRPRK
jgi:hypothetical protein